MRIFIIIVFYMLLLSSANAGQRYNSQTGKIDFCIDFRTEDGSVVNNKCSPVVVTDNSALTKSGDVYLLRAGLASGGATTMTTTDTEISTSFSLVDKEISSDPSFQNGTLPDSKPGRILTIRITSIDGNGTFTMTPDTATGFTSLVFEALDDMITLLYVDDTVGWIPITQGSVQRVN